MDLLQLEHLLAVAEEGSFTRAAERVCRTQPAVSQSIKKLEEEIGAPLFTRDVHDVTLTEAGRTLVEYARRMVGVRDDAMRRLRELGNLDSGHLSIVAHESAAVYLLPGPLRSYFARFPQIKVGIYRSRLEEIPRQVMDRESRSGRLTACPGRFSPRSCSPGPTRWTRRDAASPSTSGGRACSSSRVMPTRSWPAGATARSSRFPRTSVARR
jgi:DNA-binding transcriptional LysR family regulator